MAMASTNTLMFYGIPSPEGIERKVLYHSKFRAIYTYKMSLAELDEKLQKVLADRKWDVKVDERTNLTGKLDITNDGRVVHVSTEPCSNPMFCTMKYWIDM